MKELKAANEMILVDAKGEIAPGMPVRSSAHGLRDALAIIFRNRRLVLLCFGLIVAGTVAGALMGSEYEARTQLLVKHQRLDDVVASGDGSRAQSRGALPTEEEINSQIALIKSDDVLEQVVRETGLDARYDGMLSRFRREMGGPDVRIPKAVQRLEKSLQVYSLPKSHVIEVRLRSSDAELASRVLNALTAAYMQKHLAIHRPPGVADFFDKQSQEYHKKLEEAEVQLKEFGGEAGAVAPQMEKEIALQKASEFKASLRQTQGEIADRQKRIRSLQAQLASTPDRLDSQVVTSDNEQLLANLKSTLAQLELKRVELLQKFQPTYRPVQELEQQIDQTRTAIAEAQKAPVKRSTTDQNPTHVLLQAELARAQAELPALQAKAAALEGAAGNYQAQAHTLGRSEIAYRELTRQAKASEENYLLYLKKAEEAQISDALDQRRILNVAVAEKAAVPIFPTNSPAMLILAGLLLAIPVSLGAAFVSDYFDPSLRTPREVVELLDTPVLAWMPMNGQFPALPSPSYSLEAGTARLLK